MCVGGGGGSFKPPFWNLTPLKRVGFTLFRVPNQSPRTAAGNDPQDGCSPQPPQALLYFPGYSAMAQCLHCAVVGAMEKQVWCGKTAVWWIFLSGKKSIDATNC